MDYGFGILVIAVVVLSCAVILLAMKCLKHSESSQESSRKSVELAHLVLANQTGPTSNEHRLTTALVEMAAAAREHCKQATNAALAHGDLIRERMQNELQEEVTKAQAEALATSSVRPVFGPPTNPFVAPRPVAASNNGATPNGEIHVDRFSDPIV